MCSVIHGFSHLTLQLNLHLANLTSTDEDDMTEWCFAFNFIARLVAYIIVLALLVVIIFMILRYLGESNNETPEEEVRATESNPLIPAKSVPITYGTCEGEQDIESGSCSNSSSSSSSEELYDGKICVICYDEERNCFFVPCGHCATCYDCAQRIFDGDSKTCPVCRRFIRRVRKWFSA